MYKRTVYIGIPILMVILRNDQINHEESHENDMLN